MQKTKRILWVDLARAFAILSVVVCHAAEIAYFPFLASVGIGSQTVGFLLFTIGRLGVPIFLMISGYLLLDRKYDDASCKKFWRDKWFHLLICVFIWWFIYAIFLCIYEGHPFDIQEFIQALFFFKGVNIGSSWYMPMILGLYILIPFVAIVFKKVKISTLKFPLIIFAFFSFVFPLVSTINNILGREPMALQFSLGFSGGAYGILLIIGFLVKKKVFHKIKTRYLIAGIIIGIVLSVILQVWSFHAGSIYTIWYDNILNTLPAVCLFELMSRLKTVACYKTINFIARFSFAIYLIHYVIIKIFQNPVETLAISHSFKFICLFVISWVSSIIIAYLIYKIPKVGKYILYMK